MTPPLKFIPLILSLFLFMPFHHIATAQSASEADQLLRDLASNRTNIGITAGYSVEGDLKWSNGAGFACKDDDSPFTEQTLTRIASISKSMTAVAVMQLVEKRDLDLDVPIQTYLPNFPTKEKGEITTRQILAHTSGLSQYQNEREVENTIHYASLEEAMNVFEDRPLLFKPGTRYFYTSYGYVVLGRIIEVVSGMTYEEYMQRNIWDVAGMDHTGIEMAGANYENKSCLYHKNRRRAREANQNDLSNRIPGGGFYSTLNDVMAFGETLLDGKFISDDSLEDMLVSESVEYDGNKYGLGWFFYAPPPNENMVIGHSGGQTGVTSQLMIIPKSQTVVVVLSNTSGNYPDIATLASNLIRISESQQD